MSKKESVSRLRHIISFLKKCPASFEEIKNYLSQMSALDKSDFNISKRTFHRDLEDIRSMFEVDIEYDRSQRKYVIDTAHQPIDKQRVMEMLDMAHIQRLASDLTDIVFPENRSPQGTEFLYPLIQAIKGKKMVKFNYQKYKNGEFSERIVKPYALKEANYRWYLLAKDGEIDFFKSFGLDRMSELITLSKKYQDKDKPNLDELYKYCFGITTPNGDQENEKPAEVVLSILGSQKNYVKSLPLHSTQQIISEDDNELVISLKVYITPDFIMELLSMGDLVRVITPTELQQKLITYYKNALKRYRTKVTKVK